MTDTFEISINDARLTEAAQNKLESCGHTRVRAIGNVRLLTDSLTGFFCSTECPGDAVLRAFDAIRELRDTGTTVIGGFHSPMEKECLELLMKGSQPIVICPARAIDRMRISSTWKPAIANDRLLILSPFDSKHRSPTARLADVRNRFVADLADRMLIAHAAAGSRISELAADLAQAQRDVICLSPPAGRHRPEPV